MSGAYLPTEFESRRGYSDVLAAYVRLARPFTLLAPSLGMVSGGIVAWFAVPQERLVDARVLTANLILGAVAAALLNAASNAMNQVFDLDIDRVNKPDRPLTSGAISLRGALVFSAVAAGLALVLAALCSSFTGRPDVLVLFIAAAVFSVLYSAPPVRMKLRGWLANGTVAIPRGVLLKVAGWSLCASMVSLEAWYIGMILGLFLFGATTTKDFADITGDAAYGVRTLPVVYGPDRAARMIAPFLFLPFLLIGLGVPTGILHGNGVDLYFLCAIATCWGAYVSVLVLRDPDSLTQTENHPAWRHMYYLMVFLQLGFVLAYVPHNFFR
ncbi:Homogentisate phytyltransferase [Planctomycetaceae bacterium]|nr:Homogentisate phytyltransferase [Planctomycetaceae bacterium]